LTRYGLERGKIACVDLVWIEAIAEVQPELARERGLFSCSTARFRVPDLAPESELVAPFIDGYGAELWSQQPLHFRAEQVLSESDWPAAFSESFLECLPAQVVMIEWIMRRLNMRGFVRMQERLLRDAIEPGVRHAV
jgi:hypothetical protein